MNERGKRRSPGGQGRGTGERETTGGPFTYILDNGRQCRKWQEYDDFALDPNIDFGIASRDMLQDQFHADAAGLGDALREHPPTATLTDPLHLKPRIIVLERRIAALEGELASLRQQQRPAAAQSPEKPSKRRTRGIEL